VLFLGLGHSIASPPEKFSADALVYIVSIYIASPMQVGWFESSFLVECFEKFAHFLCKQYATCSKKRL